MMHDVPTRLLNPSWPIYWALCPVCEGKPTIIKKGQCPACHGVGCFLVPPGKSPPTAIELLTCAACDGAGKIYEKPCTVCGGAKRTFVHYCEEEWVKYRPEKDDFGGHVTGRATSCGHGYTWLMAQCPLCLTGWRGCPVCLGSSWVPRNIADAIERYIRLLPPHLPRDRALQHIQDHLSDLVALIPQGVPTRRIEKGA